MIWWKSSFLKNTASVEFIQLNLFARPIIIIIIIIQE